MPLGPGPTCSRSLPFTGAGDVPRGCPSELSLGGLKNPHPPSERLSAKHAARTGSPLGDLMADSKGRVAVRPFLSTGEYALQR